PRRSQSRSALARSGARAVEEIQPRALSEQMASSAVEQRSGRFFENAGERFTRGNSHAHARVAGIFAGEVAFPLRPGRCQNPGIIYIKRLPEAGNEAAAIDEAVGERVGLGRAVHGGLL